MSTLETAFHYVIIPLDKIRLPNPRRQLLMKRESHKINIIDEELVPTAKIGNYVISASILDRRNRSFLLFRCSCPGFRRRILSIAKRSGVLTNIENIEGFLLASPPKDLELDKHVWFAIANGLLGEDVVENTPWK